MAKTVQLRRGTTAEHATFTGASGEVTVDQSKNVVVVHDGTTAPRRGMLVLPHAARGARSRAGSVASCGTLRHPGEDHPASQTGAMIWSAPT